jgi:hypothetical protein
VVETDPKPDPTPAPLSEEESLADTEGELQNFPGSDESGDGGHLRLSDESLVEDD